MTTYTIEKEIDGEHFDFEIDIDDVLGFIENANHMDLETLKEQFEDDLREDLDSEYQINREDVKEELREEFREEFGEMYQIETLNDEMKMKLLSQAMKKYSLEELENKLGTEFELTVGKKK